MANAGTVILGIAYAALLTGVGLWLAEYMRPTLRAQAIVRALAWAAAVLVTAYLLAEAVFQRRSLFVSAADFLATGAVGMLAVAPLAGGGSASLAGPLVLALAALTHVLTTRSASPVAVPAQQTLLYAAQAALHAVGMGACIAALLGAGGRHERHRWTSALGIALMGAGLVLSSAWAWLNWGIAWRNDPRLNLLAAGWLCVVAGQLLRRDGARWGLAAQWL
ncbi:MAG: hypothetical protein QHH80_13650, partial [Anaerolineae bacterium]|nr:hypothetical protein [Anaerolineae bacterium]